MKPSLVLRLAPLLVVLPWGASAWAGDWQITRLETRGVTADTPQTAVPLQTAPNATAAWVEQRLQVKHTLPEGTRLRAPAQVELQVSSPQAVRVSKSYGRDGELLLKTARDQRNEFAVLQGTWLFAVEKQLDTVSVSAGKGQALSRNTAFTITVDPEKREASFKTEKGSIDVWHVSELKVAGQDLGKRPVRYTLKPGDPALVLPDTSNDYLVRYGSFDEADLAFQARARTAREAGDAAGQFNALLALGDVLRAAGRGAEALARYDEALALVQGPADGYWRAVLQGRRAGALRVMNRFGEAAEAYRQGLAAHSRVPPREDEDPATDQRGSLASALYADGLYRCAEAQADQVMQALDARKAIANHPSRAAMWSLRGATALETGRPAQARQGHERALEILRRLGSTIPGPAGLIATEEMAWAQLGAGETHLRAGRLKEADAAASQARAIAGQLFTTPHGLQAQARLLQAGILSARGRHAEALSRVSEAQAILEAAPPDALQRGDALALRGELLLRQGRKAEAAEPLRQARTLWQTVWPADDHPRFTQRAPDLVRALQATGGAQAAAEAKAVEKAAREGAQRLAQRERDCLR